MVISKMFLYGFKHSFNNDLFKLNKSIQNSVEIQLISTSSVQILILVECPVVHYLQ